MSYVNKFNNNNNLYILFELISSVAALVPVATTSRDSVMSMSLIPDIFIVNGSINSKDVSSGRKTSWLIRRSGSQMQLTN
jgi:hypothetical protein